MENQFALELKRQKVVADYKDALISAINLILDNIKAQKELAEQLYISDNTTGKWKLDLSFQDRLRLFALSEILNISLYD